MLRRNSWKVRDLWWKKNQEMSKWESEGRTETEVDCLVVAYSGRHLECLPGKPECQFWSESPEEQDPCVKSIEWSRFQHLQREWEAAWWWGTEGEVTLTKVERCRRHANHLWVVEDVCAIFPVSFWQRSTAKSCKNVSQVAWKLT